MSRLASCVPLSDDGCACGQRCGGVVAGGLDMMWVMLTPFLLIATINDEKKESSRLTLSQFEGKIHNARADTKGWLSRTTMAGVHTSTVHMRGSTDTASLASS